MLRGLQHESPTCKKISISWQIYFYCTVKCQVWIFEITAYCILHCIFNEIIQNYVNLWQNSPLLINKRTPSMVFKCCKQCFLSLKFLPMTLKGEGWGSLKYWPVVKDSVSDSDLLHEGKFPLFECCILYNKLSYARVLIGSHLWSIGGQAYRWHHH